MTRINATTFYDEKRKQRWRQAANQAEGALMDMWEELLVLLWQARLRTIKEWSLLLKHCMMHVCNNMKIILDAIENMTCKKKKGNTNITT